MVDPSHELPTLFGDRFRVDRPLGEGAVSRVFLATDLQAGGEVALKVLDPRRVLDPQLRARFLREAEALASLTDPCVVKVLGMGEAPGGFTWLAMERGVETCHDLARRTGGASVAQTLAIADQALRALEAVHARGWVHRDVKPANLLVVADGSIRLADFGLVRDDGSTLTRDGAVLGTLKFMAPEQKIDPRRVTARSDLYSLGVSLVAIACAATPRDMATAVRDGGLQAVPEPIRQLVLVACRERPSDRWASATAMREAVARVR